MVLDSLSAHKSAEVRAAMCRVLFVPPYPPECNAIEKAWSKLKMALRRIGARTLEDAITEAVATITASDAANWTRGAGFVHTPT